MKGMRLKKRILSVMLALSMMAGGMFVSQNQMVVYAAIIQITSPIIVERGNDGKLRYPKTVFAGETEYKVEIWNVENEKDIKKTGSVLTLRGTAENGDLVTWKPTVYSKDLVYLIDAGADVEEKGQPPKGQTYEDIKKEPGVSLKNDIYDQNYAKGEWGWKTADSSGYYFPNDWGLEKQYLWNTIRDHANGDLTYKITLDQGEYLITTGYRKSAQNETIELYLGYEDNSQLVGTVTTQNPTKTGIIQGKFEVKEDETEVLIDSKGLNRVGLPSDMNGVPSLAYIAIEDITPAKIITDPIIVERGNDGKLVYPEDVFVDDEKYEVKNWDVKNKEDIGKTGSILEIEGTTENGRKVIWSPTVYSKDLEYLCDVRPYKNNSRASDTFYEIAERVSLENETHHQKYDGERETWGEVDINANASHGSGRTLFDVYGYNYSIPMRNPKYYITLDEGKYRILTGFTGVRDEEGSTGSTVEGNVEVKLTYNNGNTSVKNVSFVGVQQPNMKGVDKKEISINENNTLIKLELKSSSTAGSPELAYVAVERIPIKEIKVEKTPNKVYYKVNESNDVVPDGIKVVATYDTDSDDDKRELTDAGYTISKLDSSILGKQKIKVTSNENEEIFATFEVIVSEFDYMTQSIKVTKKPAKIDYEVGKEFDPEGMEVTAIKKASPSDASSKDIEEVIDNAKLEYEYDFSTPGEKEVEIQYEEDGEIFFAKYPVMVSEYYTTGIKVTTKPSKTKYYIGESFDPEGLVVTEYKKASPSNATTIKRTLAEDDYGLEIPDFNKKGEKTIKVTYIAEGKDDEKEFTDTFKVNVISRNNDSDRDSGSVQVKQEEMKGSWQKEGERWGFRKLDGSLATNEWGYVNGNWYFFGETGWMSTEWEYYKDRWYYLNPANGAMMEGSWVQWQGKWYYLHKEGAMLSGQWFFSNGIWYYLGDDGAMWFSARTPDGYWVDETGAWVPGK